LHGILRLHTRTRRELPLARRRAACRARCCRQDIGNPQSATPRELRRCACRASSRLSLMRTWRRRMTLRPERRAESRAHVRVHAQRGGDAGRGAPWSLGGAAARRWCQRKTLEGDVGGVAGV
jgi:hypothetical protein